MIKYSKQNLVIHCTILSPSFLWPKATPQAHADMAPLRFGILSQWPVVQQSEQAGTILLNDGHSKPRVPFVAQKYNVANYQISRAILSYTVSLS